MGLLVSDTSKQNNLNLSINRPYPLSSAEPSYVFTNNLYEVSWIKVSMHGVTGRFK